MRTPDLPSFLFVPVTGGEGLGEFARCLTLAHAVLERWPGCRVRFVRDREAPEIGEARIEALEIAGSPTYNSSQINRWMELEPPDVAIFDSTGRRTQLDAAGRLGVRRVLIASRPSRRRKVLLRRMLTRSEQIWLVEPDEQRRSLGGWERLNLRLSGGRPRIVFLETLFPPSVASRRDSLLHSLGLVGRRYALFSPGGGGWLVGDRPASEIFIQAARRVSEGSDLATVVITGPLYKGALQESPGLTVKRSVSPERLADLMHDAEILVLGGGSSVGQGIAMRKPVVAAALGGSDQGERVARYDEQGLLVQAAPDPTRLAESVLSLHEDTSRRRSLVRRQALTPMHNGVDAALDCLNDLIEGAPTAARGGC